MASASERRAAQRRLAKELRSGTFQRSSAGARARESAAVGSSNLADIRADLEERALRNAVAILDEKERFNKDAVESRIRGGVAITYGSGSNKYTDYFPQAKLSNGVLTLKNGTVHSIGKGHVAIIKPASKEQLRSMATTDKTTWEKLAKRGAKRGFANHFLYH